MIIFTKMKKGSCMDLNMLSVMTFFNNLSNSFTAILSKLQVKRKSLLLNTQRFMIERFSNALMKLSTISGHIIQLEVLLIFGIVHKRHSHSILLIRIIFRKSFKRLNLEWWKHLQRYWDYMSREKILNNKTSMEKIKIILMNKKKMVKKFFNTIIKNPT